MKIYVGARTYFMSVFNRFKLKLMHNKWYLLRLFKIKICLL
jgi:hypothetical protein